LIVALIIAGIGLLVAVSLMMFSVMFDIDLEEEDLGM
jgi:hypothetical protein